MGTDGIFDNVHNREILEILKEELNGSHTLSDPNRVSNRIAALAKKHGEDKSYYSPFAENAKKEGWKFIGGKLDDMTVIVAQQQVI